MNFNRSTFDQASQFCQNEGKKLIEVDNQVENDLISELLLHSKYSFGLLSHVWTGGKAQSNGRRRAPTLFWTASSNPILYIKYEVTFPCDSLPPISQQRLNQF